ncbi:PIR Superfamily Protein [Plasmodium ovale wallikeri]|uniref:PIR Superfamily Protein n=1 Tax=Plasmodium ovale wallikeri TaxID=864142 RepID=A0A1A9AMQ5_PLAOA|nr:PIR Superfamily Protein [Plasmodium ovale wallikeri]SBT57469.1 PIR Superfamily Protein [Plasmodium ovale wallikeri]
MIRSKEILKDYLEYYSDIINILSNNSSRNKGKYCERPIFDLYKQIQNIDYLTSNRSYDDQINNFETTFKSQDSSPKRENVCWNIFKMII